MDGPAQPLRTWRPMALWTAAILAALGLAWFLGAVVGPLWQARAAIERYRPRCSHLNASGELWNPKSAAQEVERLGGAREASRRLSLYLRLSGSLAPHRKYAASMLGACKGQGVSVLTKLLKDKDDAVRRQAAWALGNTGDAQAVEPLIEVLQDKNQPEPVRFAAGHAIVGIGDIRAVEILKRALSNRHEQVREYAAEALGNIGPQAKDVVPKLIAALNDESDRVRNSACFALGRIGPEAMEAIPALERALTDADETVRTNAAEALKKIRGEEAGK